MAQGELWINVSSQFISWIASHTPPEPYFDCSGCTNMGICAPGSGIGLPTAHIPVNSITAAASTTVIMGGYYGVASPKPSPPPEPSIPPDQANPTLSPPPAAISPGPANPGPISLVATKPTIEASMVVVGTQTVIAGGPAAIISGITYSIPIQGGAVIVNGHTSTLSVYPPGPLPTLIVGSLTYTANSKSEYVIGSQTLTEGGVITASGETLSLAPGGSSVVMISGSSTKIESMGAAIASIGGFATASPSYVTASHASSQQFTSIWVMGFVGLSWVGCMLQVVISDMIV
jgi:hypothetical protein